MNTTTFISSVQNNKIKHLIGLQKNHQRLKENSFVIEGVKEVKMAIETHFTLSTLFVCENLGDHAEIIAQCPNATIYFVTEKVFAHISVRKTTGGLVAIATQKVNSLENFHLSENPLIIVVEGIEKPGNLGAILRTADAVGADGVIVCDQKVDIYNANVIRSSVGCIFSQQLALCSSEKAIRWLEEKQIQIIPTHLEANKWYWEMDYQKPTALIFGNEATGLSPCWNNTQFSRIKIPMLGLNDSLNVSVSAGIVLFESRKQRGF